MRRIDPGALGVFLILMGSNAYFWHSRDWNTASRLMLTYSLVDRGTVEITGLERQTGDLARHRGRSYSDKLPGYPLLAAVPYACARWIFQLPPHPLDREHPLDKVGLAHWPADYWVTLWTSGLFTAWTGALLVLVARGLDCTPRASALVGLAYGLATPAYVYATLAYGHQACAFALLASFLLIAEPSQRFAALRMGAAGFLAALGSVIELQVGPVSAILGLYAACEVLRRRYPAMSLLTFAAGAAVPTLVLMAYNDAAFGSPWDMGYFHHVNFGHVHSRDNPLGMKCPDWSKLGPLLVGRYRGLFVYAPILVLAIPGWAVLLRHRRWPLAIVPLLVCASVLLVNLGYPEWTGGWSTGPRLLLPLIPFAMIPVAALLAESSRWHNAVGRLAVVLALIGGVEMMLFQGAGGRIPNEVSNDDLTARVLLTEPLRDAVWPLWTGAPPASRRYVEDFARNLVSIAAPRWIAGLTPSRRFLQMVPLAAAQCLAIAILVVAAAPGTRSAEGPPR